MNRRDLIILFVAKSLRTFGFGYVSVAIALYLAAQGFSSWQIGGIFSATLIEDAIFTALVSAIAYKFGVRNLLMIAPGFIVFAGALLALSNNFWLLAIGAVMGIISPAGQEGGPFAALEQSLLPTLVRTENLTHVFSWYNLAGFIPAAFGALAAGLWVDLMDKLGVAHIDAYRYLFAIYALSGIVMIVLYFFLSPHKLSALTCETAEKSKRLFGLTKSRRHVWELAGLQSVDAFAGGLLVQGLFVWWFHLRYNVGAESMGPLLFASNLLAGLSFLLAPKIAKHFGLLNTMVFTHLPCSILLCTIPLMPNFAAASAMVLFRSILSQMDIPTRQAYTMLLVSPDERPAAAGLMTSARAMAQGIAPIVAGGALAHSALGLPFYLAGGLKSLYDITLYARFRYLPVNTESVTNASEKKSEAAEKDKQRRSKKV